MADLLIDYSSLGIALGSLVVSALATIYAWHTNREHRKMATLEFLLTEWDKSTEDRAFIIRNKFVFPPKTLTEAHINYMNKVLATGNRIGIMYKEKMTDRRRIARFAGNSLLRMWFDHNLRDYVLQLRQEHGSIYYEDYEYTINDLLTHWFEKKDNVWVFIEKP